MNKRVLLATAAFALAAAAVIGASRVSAHDGIFKFGFGLGPKATPEEMATAQSDMFQEQADLLGISVDTVKQGWSEGKSLSEIASANGISETDLQAKMKAQAKTRIQEQLKALVDKGVITQAQADARLNVEQQRIDSDRPFTGGKMGRGMLRHP